MQTVPNSLMGASLGEAHKWVREQMVHSNPGKPMADYTLTDENGKRINLSDLTRGKASHVTINAAGKVRSNPAHPAEIRGFMELPAPMHANRLTALTQNQITPALYNAMVNEFGLFGATQTLSILLTRPVSPGLHHTQKTANLIRARKGESLLPLYRFLPKTKLEKKTQGKKDNKNKKRNSRGRTNPRSNPSAVETANAATALGMGASVPASARTLNRAGMLNLDLDKTTTDIRREIDRMLDDAEDAFQPGEAGALLSVANRMSLRYENSEAIFNNFAQNVLAPYLITSTANINSLRYINEYILPAMREIVGNKDQSKRKLDRQYKYLVEKLATDPKDFYMGTELALIAHPAFLFPRAGLALMPVPETTRDMAFKAFSQIGTPPKWDPRTGFVMVADKSDKSGVAYLDQTTFRGINTQNFGRGRNLQRVMKMINDFTEVIEGYGTTDSSGFNVLVRDTRSMARMAGNQLYESLAWADDQRKPAFYFVDLPGIRPIPTNWPQGLIMALMETLGANRERITGLGGYGLDGSASPFNANDFLTPSGINLAATGVFGLPKFANFTAWEAERVRLAAAAAALVADGGAENSNAEELLQALANVARESGIAMGQQVAAPPVALAGPLGGNHTVVPFAVGPGQRAEAIYTGPNTFSGPYRSFADFLENIILQNRPVGAPGPEVGGNPTIGYAIDFHALINDPTFANYLTTIAPNLVTTQPITAQATSASPSVYQIMVDAVELSMRKYQYNPSKDDIYFTTVLLYYSLRNMGLDTEITGFMSRISTLLQDARTQSLNNFMTRVRARYPIGGGMPINPQQMNNYLAMRFIYEAFNDPNSEAFRQLAGVRVNPAPPVVTDANFKTIKENLKLSLETFEKEIAKTGKGSQAEQVFESMRDLIMPSIVKQMQAGKTDPLFTYVGKKAQPTEKIIESVNELFGECQDSVKEHIIEIGLLSDILSGTFARPGGGSPHGSIVQQLEAVKGTSSKLELLDDMATAMDDFMKYLPKEVTKVERAYVSKIKDFMTIIGDDLQFDKETVSDLISEVNKNAAGIDSGDIEPFPVLSVLITEMNEMQDVVAALDATIKPFDKYNSASADAGTRYSSSAELDMAQPGSSNLKKELVSAYSDLLVAVSTMCGTTTDSETVLLNIVNNKKNIPVRRLNTGILEPNPFESFVRGRESSVLVQALHKAGDLSIGSRRDYKDLFEGQVAYGRTLLEFFAELSEDTGFANEAAFKFSRLKAYDTLIDGLYKKYEVKTKAGNATKLLARDTFQLIKKTGSGIKTGTMATAAGVGTTVGLGIGAGVTGLVGGTILGATAASELTQTGIQSAVNTGQIAREAMNQSTRTVLEGMRTAGVLTREKLREMANDAITSADELVAQFKADARAFKDSLKAGVIGNAVAANEWKKRRIIGTKAKTAKALARYEEGTTFGALEAGAVAFATAYTAIDYARFRSQTRKSVERGSAEIRNQLKEVGNMLKLLEQFPRDTVGVEGTALADALTAQLDELLYFSNAQLFKMGQLQADLPNSFVDDLANGMHALGKGAEAVAGKLVELVKTGSAYSKAFAGEVAAGSLAVATLAVEDVLVPAVKTGASLTARGGLAALSFGASEIIPAMDRAEEANRLQMIGEAMKKETMGKPLSRLEQQALDGYRRRQGQ
jgi:hypothetical protein